MENSFLYQFNLQFQNYLTKYSISSKEQLKKFIIDLKGNLTVGFSKVLNSTDSFIIVKNLFTDTEITKITDLKIFLINGTLMNYCINCNTKIKFGIKYCSSKCSNIINSKNENVKRKKSKGLKESWKNKTDEEREKNIQSRKNGFIKKYGVNHNWKIEGAHDKIRKTFNKKYGVDNPLQIKEVKNKVLKTNNEKYGGNSPLNNEKILAKSKETLLKNWGVKNPAANKEIANKIRKSTIETYIKKYGYENPWDNEEYRKEHLEKFEKNIKKSFSYKDYILPSGKTIKIQGYENILIDELLRTYTEDDIIFSFSINKFLGKIEYVDKTKIRTYIPDMYVISTNTIYEVKSQWTFNNNKENTFLKAKVCIDNGLNFYLCIIENNNIRNINYEQLKELKNN